MPSHWEETTWGEAVELRYGKAIRGYQQANEAYPVFGTNGQVGTHSQFLAEGPGVILGRKGAYRGVHYSQQPFFVIDTAYFIVPKQELDMRWLYYAMHHYKLGQIDDGSPIPSTTRAAVYSSEFKRPAIGEQRDIATCLGALDDKIELNRRMNETLEEMARALFRDWFVDFGPTRRQMEGATDPAAIMGHAFPAGDMPAELGTGSASGTSTTKPVSAATLAPLFPARLGDDGLPEGWENGRLGDWATSSTTTVSPDEVDPETNYIGLEHMPRRSIALGDWETAEKVTSSKARFSKGQVLFGKLRPYFHKVGIAPVDGICSTDIVVVDGLSKAFVPFVATLMSSDDFVAYTNQSSSGTRMPRTSWKLMRDYRVARPSVATIEAFGAVVQPMHEKIMHSLGENNTLAALRDLLLPKLMSGEIRLKDAEAME